MSNAQLTVDETTLELERVSAVEGNDGFKIGSKIGRAHV